MQITIPYFTTTLRFGISLQIITILRNKCYLHLKMCMLNYDRSISFQTWHTLLKRANPTQIMSYKHAILLHKIYNDESASPEWLDLFLTQIFNSRNPNANFTDEINFKNFKNILSNGFVLLNNKIIFVSLNLNDDS